MAIRVVGNLTEPRSWRVYRVEHMRGAAAFHFGNHPVRQRELERDFENAVLIKLHLSREAAWQQRAALTE